MLGKSDVDDSLMGAKGFQSQGIQGGIYTDWQMTWGFSMGLLPHRDLVPGFYELACGSECGYVLGVILDIIDGLLRTLTGLCCWPGHSQRLSLHGEFGVSTGAALTLSFIRLVVGQSFVLPSLQLKCIELFLFAGFKAMIRSQKQKLLPLKELRGWWGRETFTPSSEKRTHNCKLR